MKENPHNFIANSKDAAYPTVCSKCGLGINKYTTPVITCQGTIIRKLPPCPYEDRVTLSN